MKTLTYQQRNSIKKSPAENLNGRSYETHQFPNVLRRFVSYHEKYSQEFAVKLPSAAVLYKTLYEASSDLIARILEEINKILDTTAISKLTIVVAVPVSLRPSPGIRALQSYFHTACCVPALTQT
jgi:hypothetical protein